MDEGKINTYVEQLYRKSRAPTAEGLLELVRYLKENQPPSFSHRAGLVKNYIEAEMRRPRSELSLQARIPLSRDLRMLRDFLAVHRTVYILEGRAL